MIVLLHGFPELAFSWRKLLPILAAAGFFVVAPDMRGYGKTVASGSDPTANSTLSYDDGISGFGMIDTISEIVALVYALHNERGIDSPVVDCIVGHDMGSSVAAHLALVRSDIFKRLVMMSAPFSGAPPSPSFEPGKQSLIKKKVLMDFSKMEPPRKHYQLYFCEPTANQDWMESEQGLKDLYRGYYYFKSALHPENHPVSLGDQWSAYKMAQMPEYYIMRQDSGMSATVSRSVPDAHIMKKEMSWMSEADLDVYVKEFARTGFQGGLNHYRARVSGLDSRQLSVFIGRRIEVPTVFVSGAQDWGNYQDPGGLERMQSKEVIQEGSFKGVKFIEDAGHWVQQEQPQKTADAIIDFIRGSM